MDGKQVFSYTQSKFDIAANSESAKHYDYTWYEMQHSTLEFRDTEAMIAACPHAGAIPMIRLPDAQEWNDRRHSCAWDTFFFRRSVTHSELKIGADRVYVFELK